MILGIETSCDDSSVALVTEKGLVLDQLSKTFDEDHVNFGGIVPERASRNHLKALVPCIEQILKKNRLNFSDLKAIAVTNRPGLQGSLIVGAVTAEALSIVHDLPIIGVNHLIGHIYSAWLADTRDEIKEIIFPHLSLVVSGGHTQLVWVEDFLNYKILGKTLDDAAGEAIDKFSNVIGYGFPGGAQIDAAAAKGDREKYKFPRPLIRENNYDFSFSGLKAAGFRKVGEFGVENHALDEQLKYDLSASYLEAVVDVLETKFKKAIKEYQPKAFSVVGGVSANSRLREKLQVIALDAKIPFLKPKLKYCTDNGAMIAYAGLLHLNKKGSDKKIETFARSLPGDFI